MADWRIQFSRTGGYAGMTVSTTVDPTTVAPEEAREIERALDAVDLQALAASGPGAPFPDAYRYDMVIERQGTRHALHLWDWAVPEELRPLVRSLSKRAMNPG